MTYTPPDADAIEFSWQGAADYTSPAADAIEFSWNEAGNADASRQSNIVPTAEASQTQTIEAIPSVQRSVAPDAGLFQSQTLSALASVQRNVTGSIAQVWPLCGTREIELIAVARTVQNITPTREIISCRN